MGIPAQEGGLRLRFLGANATVTGSRPLLELGERRLLIDCGLFQGYKTLRLRNWKEFPVDPASIDAVVLTHAHLDHCGYLPRLVREGFRGKIWCTAATQSLCEIMLPDSGRLQEEQAGYAEHSRSSRHRPAQPLYTESDARHSLQQFQSVGFEQPFEPVPGFQVHLRLQGHILGAASASVEADGVRIVFSGDIGRPDDPVMYPPAPLEVADWIVTESTYGNRVHPHVDLSDELCDVIKPVLARGGVAIIPSFAVGRAQLLLHLIAQLQVDGRLPSAPVYLNSPMAADVTGLYRDFADLHRMNDEQLDAMRSHTHIVNSVEESKALNRRHGPMVIVSASGMLTGGRVLHHLRAFASDPRNAIILCGYQAGGTRGASLASGSRYLRIYGQDVEIRAEVKQLENASAHADSGEILDWLATAPKPPRGVFITHGEPDAADALRVAIKRRLGWSAHVPDYLESVDLHAKALADGTEPDED